MNNVALIIALVLMLLSEGQIKVLVDRNKDAPATSAFKFKNVPGPAKDDAAANAKLDAQLCADPGEAFWRVCRRVPDAKAPASHRDSDYLPPNRGLPHPRNTVITHLPAFSLTASVGENP